MFFAIRHFTRYIYSAEVRQTVMEARMHPRSDPSQRCFTFQLRVNPVARIFSYSDYLGNLVHHFDVPERHRQLTLIADSLVDVEPAPFVPDSVENGGWSELDRMTGSSDYWDMLMPSRFARISAELEEFACEIGVDRRDGHGPRYLLNRLCREIHARLEYSKSCTTVESPIEDALRVRRGVCQDFSHIMIALARNIGIPCRYVSGYLFRPEAAGETNAGSATHAWVEAMLPGAGWVGFDPTHDTIVSHHHIRTAVGRDYADVPPTNGTMKGIARTELQVRVRVTRSEALLPPEQELAADEEWSRFLEQDCAAQVLYARQQEQQ